MVQILFYAYICGIAISKSNDFTTLPWDAVGRRGMGWNGTIEIAVGWDGNGTRRSVPWTTLVIVAIGLSNLEIAIRSILSDFALCASAE